MRSVVVLCLVALALSQQAEPAPPSQQAPPAQQPTPPQQPAPPAAGEQPKQQKVQESNKCSEITAKGNATLDLEGLAGNKTAVLYEIGSSDAVKKTLEKDCSCSRSEFTYMRIGRRESLLMNSVCNLQAEKAVARVSGALIPVRDVTFEGIADSIPMDEKNTGKFAFILIDVDDPRLPQAVQSQWEQLRKERLSALFATMPSKATPKNVSKEEHPQGSGPIHRLQNQTRAAAVKQEEPKQEGQEGQEGQPGSEKGPLANFQPIKSQQEKPIGIQVLEYNNDQKYMILVGGCNEYVWILSENPKLDENTFNNIVNKLSEHGIDKDALMITKTDVPDTCTEKKVESKPLSTPEQPKK